ncbi:MAG: riboflavin biosynthesis protein RibF [Planctomycetes bacterium]|nr:riboflavin biosynthesis protein RibF [Planctomycetota bacterium]
MPESTAVTIGNFDGVHRGHTRLVQAARAEVGDDGRVIVLSFDPHPLTALRPDVEIRRLTGFERRTALLAAAGADEVVRLEPTADVLDRAPDEFIADVARRFAPSVIVEGPDFRFGRGRAGDVRTLRKLETTHGYRTVVIDPVEAALANQHVVRVSSSMVRWLLERGRVADAGMLLGRPYALQTTVVPGDRRGRTLGIPTANLDRGDDVLPADGIYAGTARRPDGRCYAAAISVGTKPTFGAHARVCEAHLLDYDGPVDDYGWTIDLRFERWLRDQVRYDDVARLVEQLQRDLDNVRDAITVDGRA